MAAAVVATLQNCRKVELGRKGDHGGASRRTMRERLADGIYGMMAEIAVARGLNLAWTHGGSLVSRGDVGGFIEVRATEYENGHLPIYRGDNNTADFVLAVGGYPRFRLVGFIRGYDAKQERFWREEADPPCYWVPQGELDRDLGKLR